MTTLYTLAEQYQTLQKAIEDSDLSPEDFAAALGQIEGEMLTKIENIAVLIKQNESTVKAIELEEKRLSDRKTVRLNKMERLRVYLEENFKAAGQGERLDFALVSVAMQRNPPSVKVVDEGAIPADFFRVIPESKEINRKAILDSWKSDKRAIPGVEIISDKKRLVVR